ncbi:DUF3179 domain-containing protein [Halomonas heilongjiangensis]|uniref:DUF3179 domain-containing protein n=1 Tax=Halomonas heilongjiangensis TaxID=1387883 RepID=A0A2N7TVW3_9GAMM|nr:DUF3179 domain-containing protein [Halomonas heilongjiangensis]PMR72317.1 hypothetical protein C1H66_00105 [Halomonas heilongjiangensis]PXX86844.1 hypothetical protein CR158_21130 [Halomonas heilongjiangensis]
MTPCVLRYAVLSIALGLAPLSAAPAAPPGRDPPLVPVVYSFEAFREAVRSGGPGKDGIPSIDRPRFQSAGEATLEADDKVIGVYHRDQARAYPQRILVWHEIVNDELGGEALSITYCPLTGTALGFKRGETELGVSGKLVNSNLVMYDRATDSEWPQILGVAIDGPLVGQGLEEFRVFWTTWGAWQARHPETEVLTDQTGFVRNYRRDPYGSYNPLGGYYAPDSRRLFPVMHRDDRFPPKTEVFGLRGPEGALAITRESLREEGVVDVALGERRYTVIHDPGLDTGWAFQNPQGVEIQAAELDFTAEGVTGSGIDSLEAVNGFEAMWFAWAAFYPDTHLYEGKEAP